MESINEATLEHCCIVAYRTSKHRLGIEIGFWSMIPRDKGFFSLLLLWWDLKEAHLVLDTYVTTPLEISFHAYFKNVAPCKSMVSLPMDPEVDIKCYLIEAVALYYKKKMPFEPHLHALLVSQTIFDCRTWKSISFHFIYNNIHLHLPCAKWQIFRDFLSHHMSMMWAWFVPHFKCPWCFISNFLWKYHATVLKKLVTLLRCGTHNIPQNISWFFFPIHLNVRNIKEYSVECCESHGTLLCISIILCWFVLNCRWFSIKR